MSEGVGILLCRDGRPRARRPDTLRVFGRICRVTTVEDFYRTRYLYQLTRAGEAAERALEVYEQEIARRGELQAVALEDIRLRLRALAALPADPDPAVAHSLLIELSGRLDSLAANATAFMSSLQRTIDLQDIDEEAFLAYKDRLLAYLERFVSELVVKSAAIAALLRSIDDARAGQVLATAARREAADVAPGVEGDGTGIAGSEHAKLVAWQNRWSGIWSWFCGDRVHPSQATLLRQRARKAIPDLLATISVLQERRAGRSDRGADFRTLARWFAQAPSEEDAHRLWRAAFGLSSARHFTGEPPGAVGRSGATESWLDAEPLVVAARLHPDGPGLADRRVGHVVGGDAPAEAGGRSPARPPARTWHIPVGSAAVRRGGAARWRPRRQPPGRGGGAGRGGARSGCGASQLRDPPRRCPPIRAGLPLRGTGLARRVAGGAGRGRHADPAATGRTGRRADPGGELGPGGAPLVCTEGVPSASCHRLLASAAGQPGGTGGRACIRWRGDFDWTGLRITAEGIARYGVIPWRISAADYVGALSSGSEPLKGPAAGSAWDPALAEQMRSAGRAVMEERLIPQLLSDLRSQGGHSDTGEPARAGGSSGGCPPHPLR